MSLRPSYPARRAARAPRASARSRSVQASAPIAAAPRANRALRSSRAESATARAASWRRAGACFARLPVLPSSPCALLRALRRAPQASEPPLVAPARCAVCSRAASHRRALFRAIQRAAARFRRCGSPSAALRRFAPRVGCAGARLFAVGRRGLWPRLGLGWSAPRYPFTVLRVRRGARRSPPPPFGASSAAPPRGRGRCGSPAHSRVPPLRPPPVTPPFPGRGAASGRAGPAGGGVRALRALLPGCAPARWAACRGCVRLSRAVAARQSLP